MPFLGDVGAGIFGKRPDLPSYQPVDIGEQQTKAIEGNIKALPAVEQFAGSVNDFNSAQLQKMWETAFPMYQQMVGAETNTIMSQLRGEIPSDVQRSINDATNSRAVAGGYGGTQLGRNLTARDLGLTSLDISNRAVNSVMNWLTTLKGTSLPAPMSPTTMMLTPEQRYEAASRENQLQYQSLTAQRQNEALPDPASRGIWQQFQSMANKITGMGISNMMSGGSFMNSGMNNNNSGGGFGGGGGEWYSSNDVYKGGFGY